MEEVEGPTEVQNRLESVEPHREARRDGRTVIEDALQAME